MEVKSILYQHGVFGNVFHCRPVLKSVYLLEVHPSLCLASRVYESLEHACAELCEMYRAQTPTQKSNLEKKLLKLALHHWHILGTPGVTNSPQIQRDVSMTFVFIQTGGDVTVKHIY